MITRRGLIAGALGQFAQSRELAITIDDFNWQNIPQPWASVSNRALLDALEGSGVRTALFVVGRNAEEAQGRALLGPWDDAGHLIGTILTRIVTFIRSARPSSNPISTTAMRCCGTACARAAISGSPC